MFAQEINELYFKSSFFFLEGPREINGFAQDHNAKAKTYVF